MSDLALAVSTAEKTKEEKELEGKLDALRARNAALELEPSLKNVKVANISMIVMGEFSPFSTAEELQTKPKHL